MTTPIEGHVSTFALDVYFASGRPADAAIEAHLAECDRCRAYLASLESLGDLRPAAPVPLASGRRKPRWGAPSAAAAAIAVAAGILLLVRGRAADTGYVGTKGTPAVQLLVHRGAATWVWDGRSAVRPGDALALRVACEGMGRVAVASSGGGRWQRIADGACPVGSDPLPFTLVVDAEPGNESLAVVMSRDALDDASLRIAIEWGRRTSGTWVQSFVLPKEMETER